MIAVLLEAVEKMCTTIKGWMKGWVEKATDRTDKSHNFQCKSDKLERKWKLTIKRDITIPD